MSKSTRSSNELQLAVQEGCSHYLIDSDDLSAAGLEAAGVPAGVAERAKAFSGGRLPRPDLDED